MKVRSLYIKSPWQCQLRDVDLPDEPPAGWLLLRVEACGICGTDLTAAASRNSDWRPVGHEIAGVVEKVGPGAEGLKAGQTVALESASFCGRCALCRDGRVDLCRKAPNFWGQPAMGFSERMLIPAACAVPYEGLTPEVACLSEPAGVSCDTVKTAHIAMGDSVCLVGPGPIGLMALALAKHQGASRLLTMGRPENAKRLALAGQMGSDTFAWDGKPESLAPFREQFDHVLMTASTDYVGPGLSLLAYGGEMTYIGLAHGNATISFDGDNFHFRKLQLRASMASPAIYFPAVIRLIRAGVIPAGKMVSHVFPLSRAADAFALCRDDKQATLKVVIKP